MEQITQFLDNYPDNVTPEFVVALNEFIIALSVYRKTGAFKELVLQCWERIQSHFPE